MIYLVVVSVLVIYLVSIVVRFVHRYRIWSAAASKTTPFGPVHSIWGHLHLFDDIEGYDKVALKLIEETKTKVYSVWIMMLYPVFVVCHPDSAKVILKSSEPKTKYHLGGFYRMLMPWLGDGLLIADGKKWERNRRLLTPAFHFDILQPYVEIYNDVADILLGKMQKACSAGESIEMYRIISLATLDSMLRCTLSYHGSIQETGDDHPYVQAVQKITTLLSKRSVQPWYYLDFLFNLSSPGREAKKYIDYVHKFADDIIQSRRKSLKSDPSQLNKRKLDFLDILITAKDEHDQGLTDMEIRAEVDTFLFEGHDTTASAISWAVYCLAKYPEEQQIIYQEVKDILKGDNKLQWEDLGHMKKTTMFLKEVMRLHSTVPTIVRWTTKPIVVDGVTIPAEMSVDVNIHAIHHHPDHMVFNPRRFEDEAKLEGDPFKYIPFSAGPRNCIGKNFALNEQKVLIASMVNRFKINLVPEHDYKELPEVVMRAKYGIKINLQERSK